MAPETETISLVSTLPSGITTLIFALAVVAISVFVESSRVMTVVEVTEDIFPPLLKPLRTGSAICMIADGLTIIPLSIEVVKLTTSVSLASLKSIARPNLAA